MIFPLKNPSLPKTRAGLRLKTLIGLTFSYSVPLALTYNNLGTVYL